VIAFDVGWSPAEEEEEFFILQMLALVGLVTHSHPQNKEQDVKMVRLG